MNTLTACALGPTSYRRGLALQQALVDARAAGRIGDWLLFPDHPPVLTVGRSPSADNLRVDPATLAARGIELFEVSRGGDITWHGPGQLVGYPIVDLDRRGRDLHRYLRGIEQALIDSLAGFGLEARRIPERTGVWVKDEKIASIGIAVRRWVGYHGFALNVNPDLSQFESIHPCGLRDIRMTSMARLIPEPPPFEVVRQRVAEAVARELGQDLMWTDPAAISSIESGVEPPASAEKPVSHPTFITAGPGGRGGR